MTARFRERATARDGKGLAEARRRNLLAFFHFIPRIWIHSNGRPTIGSPSNARIFIRFLVTNTVFRTEGEHCVAGIDPTKVARFLSGRPESLRSEGYLRNNCTPATFLRDKLLCSREEGGARFYLILSPLCNEMASRFCWVFFASFFNLDDRCNLYYSVQNLTRNSLILRLYE